MSGRHKRVKSRIVRCRHGEGFEGMGFAWNPIPSQTLNVRRITVVQTPAEWLSVSYAGMWASKKTLLRSALEARRRASEAALSRLKRGGTPIQGLSTNIKKALGMFSGF